MTQDPRKQQRTDARRIGDGGTGKLDRDAGADTDVVRGPDAGGGDQETPEGARQRLMQTRDAAIEELRRRGLSPEDDELAPRGATGAVLDEGDRAQASERQDLAFATRERLAERVNRLTAALARMDDGRYGQCAVCGGRIEPARLAALPEADTCLACQERRESPDRDRAA